MFARVHKMRVMGALQPERPPAVEQWTSGVIEFSTSAGDGVHSVPRRLVLRHPMADPTRGVLLELYRPELINIDAESRFRVRGIEPTPMGSGPVCAMVQEWLVALA